MREEGVDICSFLIFNIFFFKFLFYFILFYFFISNFSGNRRVFRSAGARRRKLGDLFAAGVDGMEYNAMKMQHGMEYTIRTSFSFHVFCKNSRDILLI